MKKSFTLIWLLPLIVLTIKTHAQQIWVEQNGFVSFEAEKTESPLGNWVKVFPSSSIYVNGASNKQHLEFTGNTFNSGPPDSPLTYKFKVSKTANYRIVIIARQRLEGASGDKCNDCYIRMDGDFDSPPSQDIEADLREDRKFYGAEPDTWGFSRVMEVNEEVGKKIPIYVFKQGQVYTLTVSGRSQRYNMDCITVYNMDNFTQDEAAKLRPSDMVTSAGNILFESEIQLYPNPAKEKVLISNLKNVSTIQLYTIDGRLIHSESAALSETIEMNLNGFEKGIYIIVFNRMDGVRESKKLVIK